MPRENLIAEINSHLMRSGQTQVDLAQACRLSQGHLSKVLAGKVRLAPKTEMALRTWLSKADQAATCSEDELRRAIERLASASESRRMHILQLLHIVERLTR